MLGVLVSLDDLIKATFYFVQSFNTESEVAPNVHSAVHVTGLLFEDDKIEDINDKGNESEYKPSSEPEQPFKVEIVWRNVIIMGLLHVCAVYGGYLIFTKAKLSAVLFTIVIGYLSALGISVAAHRLWTHRAFKANLPLKILLMLLNSSAHQNSVIEWARDHRAHHKYSETDADPHNIKRGFFLAHIGWLLCRKHPLVIEYGKKIDISDLTSEPVLAFQHKYFFYIMPVMCFMLPTVVPVYFWGETWTNAWFVSTMFRYVSVLNLIWLLNSGAHTYGNRSYDRNLYATNNLAVTITGIGEGHHAFPWDYKTEEFIDYKGNFSTAFIDLMAKIGWAYDLKTVSPSMIKSRVERTGDGSHLIWGWGDKDMRKEEMEQATTLHKKCR